VELHGGSVAAASEGPGRGSEFSIRLPRLAEEDAPSPASEAGFGPAAPRPRRILVVEDSADARETLSMLLRLSGHEVETSEDAAEGLEKLAAFAPDVMLVDIGLPGMDGYDLARHVRARPEARGVALIALSGYGQVEDRDRAQSAGFDLHLTKPVDPERLKKALGEIARG
jgi:CheY-like chemotaxis protein